MNSRRSTLRFTLLVACALMLSGCNSEPPDNVGPRIQVKGTVTLDGRPLVIGQVHFLPDESKGNKSGIGASGQVKDGNFSLQAGSKPGAPPGFYKVIIQTNVPVGAIETKARDTEIPQMPTVPISPEFSDPLQTPLTAEVREGGTYQFNATTR